MQSYIVTINVLVNANSAESACKLFWEDPRWYFRESEIEVEEEEQ